MQHVDAGIVKSTLPTNATGLESRFQKKPHVSRNGIGKSDPWTRQVPGWAQASSRRSPNSLKVA